MFFKKIHRGWSQRCQFLHHAPTSPLEHGRATCTSSCGCQRHSTGRSGRKESWNPLAFVASETWLEQCTTLWKRSAPIEVMDVFVWEFEGLRHAA